MSFESNIINIYGDRGKQWLKELPQRIENLQIRLGLSRLTSVSNLSYNYVAAGFQKNTPIILKIGLDTSALEKEALALKAFSTHGAINVIAVEEGALLLERATPGVSLKRYFPVQEQKSIKVTCNLIQIFIKHW